MRYAPFQVLVVYVLFTFALIVFGPITYYGFDPYLTGGFLAAVLVAVGFGYFFGIQRAERALLAPPPASGKEDKTRVLFLACLWIALISLAFAIAQSIFAGELNLSIADLGQTYIDSYQGYERNTGSYSITFLIYTFASPPTFIASVWGLIYFRKQTVAVRGAIVLLIVGTLLYYTVGSGKQKQIGDTVVYLLVALAVAFGRGGRVFRPGVLMAAAAAVLLAIGGFVAILSQRYAALAVDAFTINARNNPLQFFDLGHPFFKWFGTDLGFALAMFCSYLSQGYFGLSLALHTKFQWTWFLGFSYSIGVIANRVFGVPWMYERTYPYRVGLETGWGDQKWHSIFPFWASDFTFPGTVVLFGVFGAILASAWMRSIRTENPYAVLVLTLMIEGALFLPANNQLFIAPGSLATVIVAGVLYWRSLRKPYPKISRAADARATAAT
jgi:hypothetical protein